MENELITRALRCCEFCDVCDIAINGECPFGGRAELEMKAAAAIEELQTTGSVKVAHERIIKWDDKLEVQDG